MLDAVRQAPSISRAGLVRITGLSPSSVSFIVNRLVRAGLIVEEFVEGHCQVGRRPTALRLACDAMLAIGVQISRAGGSVALANFSGLVRYRKSVPFDPDPEVFAHRVHAAICGILERAPAKSVLGAAVALPGTIERSTGKVIAAENLNWFNVEAGRLFQGRLPIPFHFENIARVSAVAEQFFLEPGTRLLQNFVVITPGEGLGTGIVSNGHLLQGARSMGGEFGHVVLYPEGRTCSCGNKGCWEQYVSAPALERAYAEMAGSSSEPAAHDAASIAALARRGDRAAMEALRRTAFDLGLGMINVIWALSPEAVIVGGFFSPVWDLVEQTVWEVLRDRMPAYMLAGLRIVPSRHAEDSALLGALSLVFLQFFSQFEAGPASPDSVFVKGGSVRPFFA